MTLDQPAAHARNIRRDSLILLALGAIIFALLGVALENAVPSKNVDFRVVYYPARCLLQHIDPYNPDRVLELYRAEGGDSPTDADKIRNMVSGYVYLPNAFTFTLPFALLPWNIANLLWQTLIVVSFVLACFLVWDLAAPISPLAAAALVSFLLVNSELLLLTSNSAGIVLSFSVIAVWCFLRNRFVPAGVVCLAIALLVKPQDSGLVWLYFLLSGVPHRKRALQTLLLATALSLPTLLWVAHTAPNWAQEWHSNMAVAEARGGTSDPGPTSQATHGLAMVISLQSALSLVRDDPHFYNRASLLLCAPLILFWMFLTLRARRTPANAWLALASISALTMLPVYHRQYDAKLLLLTIPACVLLWSQRRFTGWLALAVNLAAFTLTGDLTWAVLLAFINRIPLSSIGFNQLSTILQVVPASLILLAVAVFYLWAYARASAASAAVIPADSGPPLP